MSPRLPFSVSLFQPVLLANRASNPLANILTSLVSYWKLDEASDGSVAVARADSHGANHLTIDTSNCVSAAGKIGNCASFDGSADWLSRADNESLSTGDIDFTVAAWINIDTLPATARTLIGKWITAAQREWRLEYNQATSRFGFRVSSDGTANTVEDADVLGAPSVDTWYFVVVWHDAANNTINIQVNNGAVDSQAYSAGVKDSTAAFSVGGSSGSLCDCLVDEVGFWKRVLTAAERTALWNGGTGLTYPF